MNDDDRRMIRDAHSLAGQFAILVCDRDDAVRELRACSAAAAAADVEWREDNARLKGVVARLTTELDEARAESAGAEAGSGTDPVLTDDELRHEVAREIAYAMGEGEAFDSGNRDVWLRVAMAAMRPTAAEMTCLRRNIRQVMAAHVRDLQSWRTALEAEQAGEQPEVALDRQDPPVAEVSGDRPDTKPRPHPRPGPVVAVGPAGVVIGPSHAAEIVAALASGPVPTGCPNTPPCDHERHHHGIDGDHDPLPVCWHDGCRCGQPPAGWRRKQDQRVWFAGDTVPAGVEVLGLDGAVHTYGNGGDWVNAIGPVVEVEPVHPETDAELTSPQCFGEVSADA